MLSPLLPLLVLGFLAVGFEVTGDALLLELVGSEETRDELGELVGSKEMGDELGELVGFNVTGESVGEEAAVVV